MKIIRIKIKKMTKRIAVAGKGGVGKTTVVCGIVEYLISGNVSPVLVIDADPNSNLAENLGVSYDTTIADIRDEVRSEKIPQSMSKSEYINIRLQESIVEQTGFDLLVMGRPEGRECYCYVNELLRNFLTSLSKNYKYVIIDTEAGMEHLSRRTIDNLDNLFIVSIPTKVSLDTAKKILAMIPELKLKIGSTEILVNIVKENFDKIDLPIAGIIHRDEQIETFSQQGLPLLKNLANTTFFKELSSILLSKI
ncbi:MAG: AAA family ATPase [Endomicrobiia bacterium]